MISILNPFNRTWISGDENLRAQGPIILTCPADEIEYASRFIHELMNSQFISLNAPGILLLPEELDISGRAHKFANWQKGYSL